MLSIVSKQERASCNNQILTWNDSLIGLFIYMDRSYYSNKNQKTSQGMMQDN